MVRYESKSVEEDLFPLIKMFSPKLQCTFKCLLAIKLLPAVILSVYIILLIIVAMWSKLLQLHL